MKTYSQIKTEKQNKVDSLIKECRIFFAFSNEQFLAGKTPLQEGEKYVSMGAVRSLTMFFCPSAKLNLSARTSLGKKILFKVLLYAAAVNYHYTSFGELH